jgi:hypothetical protein
MGMTPDVEPFWSNARSVAVPYPGFVWYNERSCGEAVGTPLEHGLAGDLRISDAFPVTGYWTLSADALELGVMGIGKGPEETPPSLGGMPCVTVRMVLGTGSSTGVGPGLSAPAGTGSA